MSFVDVARAYEILSDDAARESFNIGAFHTQWEYDQWKAKHGGAQGKGFYPPGGPVEAWDRRAFRAGVRVRNKPILLMFYADWCVHCQQFAKHYRAVALALGDTAVVAAINCATDESLCQQEQVPGYPTLRLLTPAPEAGVETWEGPLVASEPVVAWVADATSVSLQTIRTLDEMRSRVTAACWAWSRRG